MPFSRPRARYRMNRARLCRTRVPSCPQSTRVGNSHMDNQRRTVLLATVARVFGDTAADDESTPAQRGQLCAAAIADHRADAVNTSIRAEARDDLRAWYQRWQQLTIDSDAL